jgi:hypothetical protein
MSKNLNKSNINLPYNLIRLGCYSKNVKNNDFISFYNKFLDKNAFNNNILDVY